MNTFSVVINGNIKGINHRFQGGSGEPEEYKTGNPGEIQILRRCQYAFMVTEADLEDENEGKDVPAPVGILVDLSSAEVIERAELRSSLLKISDKKLRSQLAGRKIIKMGMNNARLVDALLEHPEIVEEILEDNPAE